ncbi:MAG: YigZ family protein [Bacilli bacterium]|nr:YigZ family protein [Bacilli bacterium]MBO4682927.1 YigZ family protein [Bacilli bacterium]
MLVEQRYEMMTEVMKSKFIAILLPIKDEEEFKNILKDIRKEHRKAKHVVYAYRLGQSYKSNDDGEPKGTAGRPLLELLLKKDINNCALFVVRYFGGTKLGAGRLLRTYVQSGVNVINLLEGNK